MFDTIGIASIYSSLLVQIKREEYIQSLPINEQIILREADKKEREENEKHRKVLEIANALRPRNFFGQ